MVHYMKPEGGATYCTYTPCAKFLILQNHPPPLPPLKPRTAVATRKRLRRRSEDFLQGIGSDLCRIVFSPISSSSSSSKAHIPFLGLRQRRRWRFRRRHTHTHTSFGKFLGSVGATHGPISTLLWSRNQANPTGKRPWMEEGGRKEKAGHQGEPTGKVGGGGR